MEAENSDYFEGIDRLREQEYPALQNITYLDHAGTTLYAKSFVERFSHDLVSNLFGNPHSASPSSSLSTQRVDNVRERVLEFFKASPEDFDLIFVANATAGIKVVMDGFLESSRTNEQSGSAPGFWYGYHRDSHNSLVGVREVASGSRCFESDQAVDDWLSAKVQLDIGQGPGAPPRLGLFAYPAQSNMNGHRLPLTWPGRLRASTRLQHRNVYTLLDAAAYATTAQLDLSNAKTAPDFTVLSFYKIFGFPDLGALIVRKDASHVLRDRRYFAGGTVDVVVSLGDQWHVKRQGELHEVLEDGTLPFHSIIALESALDVHEALYGSMDDISKHTTYLAKKLYDGLSSLHHTNGVQVFDIYKDPGSTYGDRKTQGPTIAFNVRNPQGDWIGKTEFEQVAIRNNIHLRTGGVCNPGGVANALKLGPWEMRNGFAESVRCGNDVDLLGGKPTGIIRVSLGAMSSMADVRTFLDFVKRNFVEGTVENTAENTVEDTVGAMEAPSFLRQRRTKFWTPQSWLYGSMRANLEHFFWFKLMIVWARLPAYQVLPHDAERKRELAEGMRRERYCGPGPVTLSTARETRFS